MSRFFSVEQLEGGVCKLLFAAKLEGSLNDLATELQQHKDDPKLLMDFSQTVQLDSAVGMAFVQFWQQRGHAGVKTLVYGVSQELKAKRLADCFMFVERKEWADDEQDALQKINA